MTLVYEFLFLLFCHLIMLLPLAAGYQGECPPSFQCGYVGNISFPFTTTERQDCGLLAIHNCDDHPMKPKEIQLVNQGKWFEVIRVVEQVPRSPTVTNFQVRDKYLYQLLQSRNCEAFTYNCTLPPTFHFGAFRIGTKATLFRCNQTLHVRPPTYMYNYTKCHDYDLYYAPEITANDALTACAKVQLPIKDVPDSYDPFTFVNADINVEVKLTDECANCHHLQRGQCQLDNGGRFFCANATAKPKRLRRNVKLCIGLGVGILGILIIGLLLLFLLYKRKHATSGGHLQSGNSYSDSSLNPRSESGSVYFGVPLFSYEKLKEATNNFDHTRELGDGGFGTVYYGKLPDGREVAVKRLYEHNYRRVQQFINEVEILTRLRHKNLVSLYGCTSRHSRELLLVYEYISNGTVACHLHGGLAKSGLLPGSLRIKIAIETASALAYLHASGIIHRDVKTSNILLDSSFCVKVADFGLSRLFPDDVTHVSTAPQGTPGYVDPEYHQCYQLTNKSDVYSFGVVLIELISSKPAVDINRSKDEINLSNLAVKKIQESAIGELVDPSIGFDSDQDVKRMMVSVAELAFQCLQRDKELRPSMQEVLDELCRIESGKDEVALQEEADVHGVGVSHSNVHPPLLASPDSDEVGLLKNMKLPTSPNTVTDKWESERTTPNVSG
ncbi:LEAF RUST 10 DISEASE-RESISTANCE LOCUS RECEPTOR-LIKE PROTEIN KINASE-like 1.1 isoform X2 [Gastrolobium bilobum]|uniref:LEAF RUST 10 DISEASE-RESISTANCE LOCUS RECEPTOR-LIKE PROTEIN KINASE-like 1.1 isoform X2 n=1 Tax=Gastrolobium bilobum TaxID=150636 RepID=UPI002AAF664D|nr:LEAF RUST 10 DISEASE-RESISTANCE LOCUS RECEPTOR-LIKE PROTEIN KINASE-like 1.1 isoform X2 [Gastrolobium bilobum]